jgi:DNA-binding transcriptional regulator LsrR (DeoR family)
MYYLDGKSQTEIGKIIGLTPSMVSRLITEAHDKDMVEIRIHRPLQSDVDLEHALASRFDLLESRVVTIRGYAYSLLKYLGAAGAETFKRYIEPETVIGIAWGTTLSAVVDAFEVQARIPSRLVELTGAMGSRSSEYEGHGIITRLANKMGAEYHFLNAPFLCENPESAQALLKNSIVSRPLEMAENASAALMGMGSLDQNLATVLRFGYLSKDLLQSLSGAGAVGNVCGLYFDIEGQPACSDFCRRIISISKEGLLKIPVRIGVAGGADKVAPIIGALRGGYINILVTDNFTARAILDRTQGG